MDRWGRIDVMVNNAGVNTIHLPANQLVDRAVDLPEAMRRSFWLQGAAWPCPDDEQADMFVKRLVRDGLLVVPLSSRQR